MSHVHEESMTISQCVCLAESFSLNSIRLEIYRALLMGKRLESDCDSLTVSRTKSEPVAELLYSDYYTMSYLVSRLGESLATIPGHWMTSEYCLTFTVDEPSIFTAPRPDRKWRCSSAITPGQLHRPNVNHERHFPGRIRAVHCLGDLVFLGFEKQVGRRGKTGLAGL